MTRSLASHALIFSCAAMLSVAACGDDNNTEGDEAAASETDGGDTDSATDSAETDSASASGDGDGDPATDTDTDTGDGDGDPTTDTDTDTDTDGETETETGDGDGDPTTDTDTDTDTGMDSPCLNIEEQDACDADPECQSVVGQPLKENGPDSPCLEPAEFLGCIPQMGCDDAETWFCIGGNGKLHLLPDSCGPDGAEMCDPPAEPVDACP